MWQAFLRDNYSSLDEWRGYSDTYGLAERLGYASADEAWLDNPFIKGSTDPRDFGKADLRAYYGRRMRRWSNEKLDKEAFFAIPGSGSGFPEREWAAAIAAEQTRRGLAVTPGL
jgi:hypothetical protein